MRAGSGIQIFQALSSPASSNIPLNTIILQVGYPPYYYIEIKKVRQQPTFPTSVSIIGVRELDFRVRDGNGYCLSTMATGQFIINYPLHTLCKRLSTGTKGMFCNKTNRYAQKFLSGINNMVKPHDLLVPLGCIRRRTCTCGLSTG